MIVINKAKYAEIGRQVRALPLEKARLTHEWEEVVHKMCASNNAALHDIGVKELDELKRNK